MKSLRILALMHPQLVPPDSLDGLDEKTINLWKTEYDVVSTLRARGHEVRVLGVQYDLSPIGSAVAEFRPDLVFNMLEEFHGESVLDQNVVSYLELLRIPYTGCNPRGLILSRSKPLAKKLLAFHRIPVPDFVVFPIGRKVRRPARLRFPLIVKSATEHASAGIAKASVVDSDDKLAERVRLIHERVGTDAIAEEFIAGRELYVGVFGNDRLVALPTWELVARNRAADDPLVATAKLKHDIDYQERMGVAIGPAELPPELEKQAANLAKRVYRTLELTGYARVDFRLDIAGRLWCLEANPNPEIAQKEEFAAAARHAGLEYPDLLERLVRLGMRGSPE